MIKLHLYNSDIEILSVSPRELNIKEAYVIGKSIEMFDDDDPCIIHRTYALEAILHEIYDLVEYNIKRNRYEIHFSEHFEIFDKIDTIFTGMIIRCE